MRADVRAGGVASRGARYGAGRLSMGAGGCRWARGGCGRLFSTNQKAGQGGRGRGVLVITNKRGRGAGRLSKFLLSRAEGGVQPFPPQILAFS